MIKKEFEDLNGNIIPLHEYTTEEDVEQLSKALARGSTSKKITQTAYYQYLEYAMELILYKNTTRHEFIPLVSKEYGITNAASADLWDKCRAIIKERFKEKQEMLMEEHVQRYIDLLDRARADGNKRVERETLWDMARMFGFESKKLDITSDGAPLDIRINLSNAPRND